MAPSDCQVTQRPSLALPDPNTNLVVTLILISPQPSLLCVVRGACAVLIITHSTVPLMSQASPLGRTMRIRQALAHWCMTSRCHSAPQGA